MPWAKKVGWWLWRFREEGGGDRQESKADDCQSTKDEKVSGCSVTISSLWARSWPLVRQFCMAAGTVCKGHDSKGAPGTVARAILPQGTHAHRGPKRANQ